MTLKEAHEKQRQELISLRRENKKLKEGTFTDAERAALEKENRRLKRELDNAAREKDRCHSWYRRFLSRSISFRIRITI